MGRLRLRGRAPGEAQRREHDRHRPWVVLPVLLMLLAYAWCFTPLAQWWGLPGPVGLFGWLGPGLPEVIADGRVVEKLRVSYTELFAPGHELVIVFAALFGCFLCVYFAPLRWKTRALVGWFFPVFAALYGVNAALTLLAGHLAVYLAFHPRNRRSGRIAAGFGGLVGYLLAPWPVGAVVSLVGAALGGVLYRRWVGPRLAREGRFAGVLRALVVHSCMLTIAVAAVREGLGGAVWTLPVGLLWFFYGWARLMVYQADHRDGEVPRDLELVDYLAVFCSPAGFTNVAYAPYLGQGYAYLDERRLAIDKTALVRSGLGLWGLALGYLLFAEQIAAWVIAGADRWLGVKVYAFTSQLVRAHLRGEPLTTPTVLLSTLLDQGRIFLIYGGVTHFRVGAWRVFGYGVDTQYDRPWLATNLAGLWGRFAFHFREFLVRVFYYPVFLAWFRRRPALRIFVATMVATVVGNLVWGHVPPATLTSLRAASVVTMLSTWPYFVLLGTGIALTQVWLFRRPRTRRPWTRDGRVWLDVVCAYLTLQYFALIHVFIRPQEGGSPGRYVELFLLGLGIDLR